jgi:hypothetical protein
MPAATIAAADLPTSSSPSSLMEPARGASTPAMLSISVVLPAPLGPRRQVIWPRAAVSDTPFNASILP